MSNKPAYVTALLRPEAYVHEGHRPEAVELVETHVSYLFLTGEVVYKVKKAVDLGFLDFRELDTRRHYCEEELRLNRRYSPDVYLDTVPVVQEGERITLGGPGEVIDYAVKMRQVPRDQMLDARLRTGSVSKEDIVRVARRIAEVHASAERILDPAGPGGWEAYQHHVEENISQTERAGERLVAPAVLEDIAAYCRAFIEAKRGLFEQRSAQGKVVDGHGDLHTGQICLLNGIEFIDCLEFSPAYRCGDVAADLAFPAMDLDHCGRPDLAEALVDAYVQASADAGVRDLLCFFKCYRAHVRAKVALLKLDSPGMTEGDREATEHEARSYFELARSYALRALPKPALYVVMGLPGTGKSTLALGLAARWGLPVWRSDVERKRLMGLKPTQRGTAAAGKGIYRSRVGRQTYGRLFELAEADLRAGGSVVLDATFGDPRYREEAVRLAEDTGAAVWLVECVLTPDQVRERIAGRQLADTDASDASFAIYEVQRRAWAPVGRALWERHLQLDTDSAPDEVIRRAVFELFRRVV